MKVVVPRITEESKEDYNFDDDLRADMLKSWKLLCPLVDRFPKHLSVWKSGQYGAAVRYDKGSCFGWGAYTICTLIMPIRLDEDDNIAYSKDHAMKIQSDMLNAKHDEPAKPEEEQKPEAVQPTPETREQSLEY